MPIDDAEGDRLRIVHQIYLYLFNKSLTTVPLERPRKILDIGCGMGDWAIEMGDMFPQAEIIGTDIAKIQPSAVPPNVFFEIDDAEEEDGWTWPEDEFDLVHLRSMAGAFRDWRHVYGEALNHLRPGGWIEVIDLAWQSDIYEAIRGRSIAETFLNHVRRASELSGRPRSYQHLEPQILMDLGFDNVSATSYEIPMGGWPHDKSQRNMGKFMWVAGLESLEAMALRLLTEQLDWTPEEVRRQIDIIVADFHQFAQDPEMAKKLKFKIQVLTGQKPGSMKFEDDEMSTNSEDDDGEGEGDSESL